MFSNSIPVKPSTPPPLRLFGFTALVVTECDKPWLLHVNPVTIWPQFVSPVAILALFYALSLSRSAEVTRKVTAMSAVFSRNFVTFSNIFKFLSCRRISLLAPTSTISLSQKRTNRRIPASEISRYSVDQAAGESEDHVHTDHAPSSPRHRSQCEETEVSRPDDVEQRQPLLGNSSKPSATVRISQVVHIFRSTIF